MNILSLFDGISCGQLALNRANIKYSNYYSSEIKKQAIKVTQHHFPNSIQLGDVNSINFNNLPQIDLLLAGSPCQDLSTLRLFSNNRVGLSGNKSSLFFKVVEAIEILKPKYFLIENVCMKKEDQDIFTKLLGVEPILINSNLVSFQNRKRLYWTNIPNVTQPVDKNINFQDFIDSDFKYCNKFKLNKTESRIKMWSNGCGQKCKNITYEKKIGCLTTKQDRSPNSGLIQFDDFCRYLTTREIELAQTLPIGYLEKIVSMRQEENLAGDGWTVDVISHILSFGDFN